MNLIAMYESICPSCGWQIVPGDEIHAYRKQWYHSACQHNTSNIPPSWDRTAHVKQRPEAQERAERILKAKRRQPWMSIRELADYTGESKSTVGRVLKDAWEQQEQARPHVSREEVFGRMRSLAQQ